MKQNLLKNVIMSSAFIASGVSAVALDKTSSRIDYLKGDINQKAKAVAEYSQEGDNSLSIEALDFVLNLHSIMGEDAEVSSLAIAGLDSLSRTSSKEENLKITDYIINVFKTFDDDSVKISSLNAMGRFTSQETLSVINSYLADCMQKGIRENDTIHTALALLKNNGNRSSFNILFLAHITDVWSEYTDEIVDIYNTLISSYAKDVVNISVVLPSDQKLKVINEVESNPAFTDSIKGELYENLFDGVISNGQKSNLTSYDVELELSVLNHLASVHWTRSASKVTDFFSTAQKQYETGVISSKDFAAIIKDIVQIANTTDTALVMTDYLNYINTLMAKNIETPDEIVLTLIDALATLGDKTAFDYLLAVSYFNYAPSVKDAAQDALTKLKW